MVLRNCIASRIFRCAVIHAALLSSSAGTVLICSIHASNGGHDASRSRTTFDGAGGGSTMALSALLHAVKASASLAEYRCKS